VRDPWEKNVPGHGVGRDPVRTPMPWDGSPNAGFTAGTPWLPVGDDYPRRNVAAQAGDPNSILSLYRRLLALRRSEPALFAGAYSPAGSGDHWLAYRRQYADRRFLVALNLGPEPVTVVPEGGPVAGRVAVSTHPDRDREPVRGPVALRGDEALVIEINR
jgi:alpha-glucosidase